MSHAFKVGDRVIYRGNSYNDLRGCVGVVVDVERFGYVVNFPNRKRLYVSGHNAHEPLSDRLMKTSIKDNQRDI